ncbi:GNAT family N-acetyltransferase [Pseudoalteromonas sp. Ld20]|uniref:GNAT family N-acetyltransferase n=1 Tax=Pseudoalteromonas sp. Ld20 TaxID=649165 RepID=UPI00386EEEEA
MAFRFECLDPVKTPLVNKFYDSNGARGRANKQDAVWVAYADFDIIAACRIQNRGDHLFLSTLLVTPSWRGKGIARQLLSQVIKSQQQEVYTFAYQSLIDFYRSIGFNFVLTLPEPLATLFCFYQQRKIVAMSIRSSNYLK